MEQAKERDPKSGGNSGRSRKLKSWGGGQPQLGVKRGFQGASPLEECVLGVHVQLKIGESRGPEASRLEAVTGGDGAGRPDHFHVIGQPASCRASLRILSPHAGR